MSLLTGMEFQKKALEAQKRLEVTIVGIRSDGFEYSEKSVITEENKIKDMVKFSKRKRLEELLTGTWDYKKYGKDAGTIPEVLSEDSDEYFRYKQTRLMEGAVAKFKKLGISYPEDVSDHPVPRIRRFLLSYVDGTGTYDMYEVKNGKRIK